MDTKVTRQMRRAAERRVVRLSLSKADRRRLFRKDTATRRETMKTIIAYTINQIRDREQHGNE